MQLLENLYALELKKIPFIERKATIGEDNTLITGPAKSGKTYIVFNYLLQRKRKKYLYIDLNDLRLEGSYLVELENFILVNSISILVLDNWNGFDYAPNSAIQKIYVSRKNYELKNFRHLAVTTLDFEEYILFENNPSTLITHTFNNYMKSGTIPQITQTVAELKHIDIQNMLREVFSNRTKMDIFIFLLKYIGYSFSLHQIFQAIKKETKLSKDKFYLYISELIDENMLFFVPKYGQPNGAKKIYLYDFALRDGITFDKKFTNVYENMILKELMKIYKNIFYYALIDFYIPDEKLAVIAMPFASKESIKNLLPRISTDTLIKKAEIITIGFEDDFIYNNIQIDVIPYWTWALKDEK